MTNRRGSKSRRRRPRKVQCVSCGHRMAAPNPPPAVILCACGKPLDGGAGSRIRNGQVLSQSTVTDEHGSTFQQER